MADLIYLDHAASTPPFAEVIDLIAETLRSSPANPTGAHTAARAAVRVVEDAREQVAAAVGVNPGEVVFTSGGSEADNTAILGLAAVRGRPAPTIAVSAIEHGAVLEAAREAESLGAELRIIEVDDDGLIDPTRCASICRSDTALASVMLVNNEVGVIEPIAEIAGNLHLASPGAVIHTDAAQAFSTQPIERASLEVDAITISGHKIGGPQGVGALIVRDGLELRPLIRGGGQELGRRAGTHNVAGIAGFGLAVEMAAERRNDFAKRARSLTERAWELIASKVDGAVVNGSGAPRAPHILSLRFEGIRAEDALVLLDREGVCISSGASCASGAQKPSHVLSAMGCSAPEARSTLRLSVGWSTTEVEIDLAAEAICVAVATLRREK